MRRHWDKLPLDNNNNPINLDGFSSNVNGIEAYLRARRLRGPRRPALPFGVHGHDARRGAKDQETARKSTRSGRSTRRSATRSTRARSRACRSCAGKQPHQCAGDPAALAADGRKPPKHACLDALELRHLRARDPVRRDVQAVSQRRRGRRADPHRTAPRCLASRHSRRIEACPAR